MIGKLLQRWRTAAAPKGGFARPGPRPRGGAAKRFVAVDFDSRQVRLVQAERAGAGIRIIRALERPAPEGLDLADAKAVGELLRAALRENRLAGWPVIMCVPRGLAVLKALSFPPGTSESELASMVQYQVEKELPFRAEEAVVDFTAESHFHVADTPQGAGGTSVLVAAVRVPVVDYYRQIAQAAGARLLRLGLRPYANQRCFAACLAGAGHERCALVHLTADETEIDVIAGQALVFSRSALGKVPDPAKAGEAEREEAVAGVVTEVVRSLQSYQSVEGGGKVDQVYLAGGTGLEEPVARALGERLGLQCCMLQPAEALRLGTGAPRPAGKTASTPWHPVGGGGEFLTALGLAIGNVAPPLDFLAPKRPAPRRNVRRTAALAGAAALVLLLVAAVALPDRVLADRKALVRNLESEYRKVEARRAKMSIDANRLAVVEAWERGSQEWLDHFALLSALFPSAQDAYASGITGNADGTLRFTIHAATEEDITRITKQLDDAGYVASAGQQSKTNDPKYPHTAEMTVRAGPNMDVDLDTLESVPRPEDDLASGEVLPRPRPAQPAGGGNAGGPRATGGPGTPNQPTGDGRDPNRPRRFGGPPGFTGAPGGNTGGRGGPGR